MKFAVEVRWGVWIRRRFHRFFLWIICIFIIIWVLKSNFIKKKKVPTYVTYDKYDEKPLWLKFMCTFLHILIVVDT